MALVQQERPGTEGKGGGGALLCGVLPLGRQSQILHSIPGLQILVMQQPLLGPWSPLQGCAWTCIRKDVKGGRTAEHGPAPCFPIGFSILGKSLRPCLGGLNGE